MSARFGPSSDAGGPIWRRLGFGKAGCPGAGEGITGRDEPEAGRSWDRVGNRHREGREPAPPASQQGRPGGSWTCPAALTVVLFGTVAFLEPTRAFAQDVPSGQDSPEKSEREEEDSWMSRPNVGYGPFHQTALGFWNSLRPGFTPRSPMALPKGTFELRATESWAKDIAENDGEFDLDYEILRTEASVAYGLTGWTLLELDFDTATRVHGILDPLMNGFHNTFGIPLGPRGRLPNNSFRVEMNPGHGRPPINLDHDAGTVFTRSLVLTVQNIITYGDDWMPAVSFSFSLQPALGQYKPFEGGSPLDLSTSISASKALGGGVYLYLAFDYSLYGNQSFAGTPLRSYEWSNLFAAEWNCLEDFSLVVQLLTTSPPVTEFERFSKPAFELCGGFKIEIAPDFRIDFGLLHDIQNPVGAPDFGFQLEFSVRF